MASLISIGGIYRGSSIVAVRRQYVTNLVNTLKEQGQKPGILAMNALMAVKLDNDENVDVVEFLQQLENKGLELNNTSYELMARAYAKTGNVNAILSILSHLKDEDNNVGTIAKASNTDDHWHSAGALYLNAALGLAQKGNWTW
uniref:Pentatricopeptide repeat-containing protein n=1 Tax=Ditylenchus dipsaci TaxID=166011 RepID=A0A915E583_9BILA